ncbi:MAG: TonB-dependent receptor [Rhodothermia bacterium]|nr:TonB-dependent receptor [Rhodothermia bacterium]
MEILIRFMSELKGIIVLASVALVTFTISQTAMAQELGSLAGYVTEEDGRPLEGVNVYLENEGPGTASAANGKYVIDELEPGRYVLVGSLLGYEVVRRNIDIFGGQRTEVDLQLEPKPITLGEVIAIAERTYSAASSVTIRQLDLITRPARSSQDLLRLAPGLITAQHAGGGKAEQIFLRGFDADHGTDVSITVDGMPVNMVSHGHGQGYADLHFLIPETVGKIDVTKGPYATDRGNLATAGAISFTTRDHLDNNVVSVSGGAFNTINVTSLYQLPFPDLDHQGAYLAGQFYSTDGPVERDQDFQRFNLFGKFHTHLSDHAKLGVSVGGFSSAWDASGQVPARAVDQGLITRFGSLDDLEGGSTGRQNINLTYDAASAGTALQLRGYTARYTFKLFSNFTFFLDDPLLGDMIEQTDNRTLTGLDGRYRMSNTMAGVAGSATLGGGFRSDNIAVGLWKSPNRQRLASLVDADIVERNLYLWGEQELFLSSELSLKAGLRGDYFTFDVNDHLDRDTTSALPHASGYAHQAILSPKASLVYSPSQTIDVFLNAGSSFHSNDARNVVLGQRIEDEVRVLEARGLSDTAIRDQLTSRNLDPDQRGEETLPRATGAEIGLRSRLTNSVTIAAAAWLLDLDREYVYVGDGGFTELSDRSRRYGLDVETRAILTTWLLADIDVNLSRGFFPDSPDSENRIPLAPTITSTGGITVLHPKGYEGSLRFVHVGDRPASENASVTAEGYTLVNLFAAYRFSDVKVSLTVENLLDTEWNEAQFDTESRLRNEIVSVSGLHFTPGNPRNVRLGLAYHF